MNITMGGLNHHSAGVEVRERFALAADALPAVLREICRQPGIAGCVILATCNRMEVYLSHEKELVPDVPALLCAALGVEAGNCRAHFSRESGRAAVAYLCEVAAGIQSRIVGEDQILTQVKEAIAIARGAGAADAVLEALFRTAVTAGKQVKTRVRSLGAGGSVALEAVARLDAEWAGPGRRVLVIGNGAMGRLAAEGLLARGYAVTMTLRAYRHGCPELPAGCTAVPYEDRYAAMEESDIVVSATSSPHCTVKAAEFSRLQNPPALLVDLAVPRDIEPGVGEAARLWNVDDLATADGGQNEEALREAAALIEEQIERFAVWHHNRENHGQMRRLRSPTADKSKERVAMRMAAQPAKSTRPRLRREARPNFPAFISLEGRRVLVAGGGKIATRRVEVLLRFGAEVLVVSPQLSEKLDELARAGAIRWQQRPYEDGDLEGALLAVAATSEREVNRQLGQSARRRGILVSVADCQEECSFYFPAIVQSESLTAGIVSNHGDHALVRKTAATLRERLDEIEAENTDWQPGEPAGGGAGQDGDGGDSSAVS